MQINRYQALFSVVLAGAFSLACSTSTVTLAYRPAVAPATRSAVPATQVSVGDFTDNRKEPLRWIGAIRGGYGNPLKVLETTKPSVSWSGTLFGRLSPRAACIRKTHVSRFRAGSISLTVTKSNGGKQQFSRASS